MKLKTTLQHELADFRQSGRLGGLGGDDALRTALAAHTFDLPSNSEFVVEQANALQLLVKLCETIQAELAAKPASVRYFDHSQYVGGEPDFVFGASCLTKSRWKTDRPQLHRENQRFQKGGADAVSRPTASKSRNGAAHSAIGEWALAFEVFGDALAI